MLEKSKQKLIDTDQRHNYKSNQSMKMGNHQEAVLRHAQISVAIWPKVKFSQAFRYRDPTTAEKKGWIHIRLGKFGHRGRTSLFTRRNSRKGWIHIDIDWWNLAEPNIPLQKNSRKRLNSYWLVKFGQRPNIPFTRRTAEKRLNSFDIDWVKFGHRGRTSPFLCSNKRSSAAAAAAAQLLP